MSSPLESAPRVVRFGPFELNEGTGELRKSGTRLTIQDQPFKVLTVLLERPGELVTREVLRQRLWPSDTFVDFEHGLNAAVGRLRETLGDSADVPRFIETLPRRGYRFIGTLVDDGSRSLPAVAAPPSAHDSTSSSSFPLIPSRFVRRRWIAGAAAALAVAGVVAALLTRQRHQTAELDVGIEQFRDLQVQPLTLTGDVYSGAISPDGRFVAYARKADGLWVRQISADRGLRVVPFVQDRAYDNVTFTPDGNSIDFVIIEGGQHDMWRVPLLGGTARPLLKSVSSSPGWSADGRRLAFVRNDPASEDSEKNSLVVADADGSNERVLATRERFAFVSGESRPTWSPDGAQIMVIASVPPPPASGFSHTHALLTIDASTGAVLATRTINGQALLYGAAWLDEHHAILSGHAMGPFHPALSAIDFRTGRVVPITHEFADFFGIALDADRRSGLTLRRTIRAGLWVGDSRGEDSRQVVPETLFGPEVPILDATGGIVYKALRGDGTLVLYRLPPGEEDPVALGNLAWNLQSTTPEGRFVFFSGGHMGTLYRVNSDGTNRKTLVERDAVAPLATSKGSVLFSSDRTPGLFSVSVDGSPVRELMRRSVGIWRSISPDGQRLLQSTHTPDHVIMCDLPDCTNIKELALRSAQWSPSGTGVAFVQEHDRTNIWEQSFDGGSIRQLTHFNDGRQIFSYSWSPDYKRLVLARGTVADDLVLLTGLR